MDQIPDYLNDVGPGWRPLLLELHEQLIEAGFSYELLQQKEKFGILRVYIRTERGSRERADLLVYAAERKSRTICEDCGEPGVLRTDRLWLRTLCDECNGKQPPRVSAE